MKTNYKIAAAIIGSFALGVGAASVLHAQAKPPAYSVAMIDVRDEDGYTKEYLPKVQPIIKEFGGKFLGGGYNKAVGIGTQVPNRVVLVQFPDMETAKALFAKAEEVEKNVGEKYASFRHILIEGAEQK
jgi:uncharacterized protein (DUF1330 family)